jgi:putative ABC transport system permease protein
MFTHYINLALRSFKRSKGLTTLMVLAIALGVCASTATMTIFLVMSGDPLPGRSERVFRVQLDAQDQSGFVPGAEPDDQLSRFDAEALLRDKRAQHQALMTGGALSLQAASDDPHNSAPEITSTRYTSADFFSMFAVPFAYGQGWTADDDQARARVVVISRAINDKYFAGANSVGRSLRLNGVDVRVIGVLGDWQPIPHFYDLNIGT